MKCPKCGYENAEAAKRCGYCNEIIQTDEYIPEPEALEIIEQLPLLKPIPISNGFLSKIKDLLLSGFCEPKDISAYRLYQHLRDMGIDASPPERRIKEKYARSWIQYPIRLKGLNIDEIQLNKVYNLLGEDYFHSYRIDYIVRGFEKEKWQLKRKLEELEFSVPSSVSRYCTYQDKDPNKVMILPEKKDHLIRIKGLNYMVDHCREKMIVEKGGKRVKYGSLKDEFFPSRETITAYDNIALRVRRILEGGDSLEG